MTADYYDFKKSFMQVSNKIVSNKIVNSMRQRYLIELCAKNMMLPGSKSKPCEKLNLVAKVKQMKKENFILQTIMCSSLIEDLIRLYNF